MAAAYAALLSLSHILQQILNPPPTHHFILPTEQIQSLQVQVLSIISFFEKYSKIFIKEIEDLENRIVGAVYKAEDVIESDVVRQILAKFDSHPEVKGLELRNLPPIQKMLENAILEVITNLNSIQRELDEIIKSRKDVENVSLNSTGASSSRSFPSGKNIMVGFDEHVNKIKDVLTSDDKELLIVPIVGMGGIGKTTLATNVYNDTSIIQRFVVRAWVSVSQEYKERDIVITLLQQINGKKEVNELSTDALGLQLHQELFKRRYLIVLDDMWDICAWENLNRFLPNDWNGSRIVVTTRLQQLAADFKSREPYNISLLNEEKSWKLIHEYVFGKEKCPSELHDIGRSIARECGGLPLALAVIGGLLAKSEKTRDFWQYINKNVTSAAKQAEDSHCIHILRLSFSELPIHLKPCFLYLAVFPKNIEIRRSRLIRLWVAEGFIKPTGVDSLEEVGEGYLEDLLDRNLVMISKLGNIRRVKSCSIHDLIRELCMEEAQKNKFLCIAKLENSNMSPAFDRERRLSIHAGIEKVKGFEWRRRAAGRRSLARLLNDVVKSLSMEEIMWLINSRHIISDVPREFPASSLLSLAWNLQTLVLPGPIYLPSEFWQMPQLRHLKMPEITIADPSDDQVDDESVVKLENLQTLSLVKDFTLRNNVVRRIPNLKKLGIDCWETEEIGSFCLRNLVLLRKLESLVLNSRRTWENMAFPDSLKKLTLSGCRIPWKDMSVIGSLPNLEVLKLRTRAAEGKIWKPNEGEFCRLKLLLIDWCPLEILEADERNFPYLEDVQLIGVKMEEFPMDFAQIATLRTIDLRYCSKSLFLSAKKLSEDRVNAGYEAIQIQSYPKESQSSSEDNVVGLEDEEATLIQYLNEDTEELDIISIVGWPGLGKTALARKIYCDPKINFEFLTLIWVYVSREFNFRDVLLTILTKFTDQDMSSKSDQDLTEEVRSRFEKGRFLLFVDDVWTVEDWKQIEAVLPKKNKLGKVLITSRHANVAAQANRHRKPHHLRFLRLDESWELLQRTIFGSNACSEELKEIGNQIVKQCRGVPFAVVVIGGILVEKNTPDMIYFWKEVLNRMCLEYDNQKRMDNIIAVSYSYLPHDLRDCFLYLGMFPDGTVISAWELTRLWIAEEFIQQNQGRSLEEVAEDNLNDLIARKLVTVVKSKANGGVKSVRFHGIIREFCQNQAASEDKKLFHEVKNMWPIEFDNTMSRLCILSNVMDFSKKMPKGPNKVRSFFYFSKESINLPTENLSSILEPFDLLRVIDVNPINSATFPSSLTKLIHLRYITLSGDDLEALPAAVSELWNLQTIKIDNRNRECEIEGDIGKMKELRYLKTKAAIVLKEMKSGVGENLHTLSRLSIRCCTKEFFNTARNLKNLGIRGEILDSLLNNLEKLERLEKLKLVHETSPLRFGHADRILCHLPLPHCFPPNLRFLTLSSTNLDWSQMTITLGKLPNLEVLKLKEMAFRGYRWTAEGGGFPCLESLLISDSNLVHWTASVDSFPKLKNLILHWCSELQEIPSVLGRTLQLVEIERGTPALVLSAKMIEAEKQRIQGGQLGDRRGEFKLKVSFGGWKRIKEW